MMTKDEFLTTLAGNTGMSKAQAGKFVETFFETVIDGVQKHDAVRVGRGLTFKLHVRAPRDGRNPRTGEKIKIAETRAVSFKYAL